MEEEQYKFFKKYFSLNSKTYSKEIVKRKVKIPISVLGCEEQQKVLNSTPNGPSTPVSG